MLIMCIFDLQVSPTMHMYFNYWTFDFCLTLSSSGSESLDRRKRLIFLLRASGGGPTRIRQEKRIIMIYQGRTIYVKGKINA